MSFLSRGFVVQWTLLNGLVPSGRAGDLLDAKLIITHKPKVGAVRRTKMWETRKIGGKLYAVVPRLWLYALCIAQNALPPPKVLFPPMIGIECEFIGKLDNNQRIVVDHLLAEHFNDESVAAGAGAALLSLKAGSGKTYIAAALIATLRLRTLYVVCQDNLRVQAIGDLRSVLTCKIGPWSPTSDNDVDIVIINTAVKFDEADAGRYSLVIYDEVHKYASPERKAVLRGTMTWVCLGMSATIGERKDGLDVIYHKELALRGAVIAEDLPGFNMVNIMFFIDLDVINYHGPSEHTQTRQHPSTGMVFTPWMQKDLMEDKYRTRLIANELAKLYLEADADGNPVHWIYVFCEERDHLRIIFEDLRKLFDQNGWELYAPEIGQYVGGIKTGEIERIVTSCRVYLTTYGYSSTGVSVNRMTAIILATPRRAGMTQVLGRILRRDGNPHTRRRVIDIIDAQTVFRGQFRDRLPAYLARDGDVLDDDGQPTGERYLVRQNYDVHWENITID